MRQTLVVGNWKLNGDRSSVVRLAESVIKELASSSREDPQVSREVVLCPTHVHLADVLGVIGNSAVRLGAQDCSTGLEGALTGDVAAPMLVEFGCEYVIVGHSERRQGLAGGGESSDDIAVKFGHVQQNGMTPILCIGETLQERQQGSLESVLSAQIDAVVRYATALAGEESAGDSAIEQMFSNTVIAYEPVWAIGTGETASPEQAQSAHAWIRSHIASYDKQAAERMPILYGGSVKPGNAGELFGQPDIDGGLIGGASLQAGDFVDICTA